MTDQANLHKAFAESFHAGQRVRPATETQLADAEAKLGVLWPVAYRRFALANGAVYCPAILDLIVERKAAIADVQQFLTPRQSVTETRRWKLEPDGGCAAFASDCSGNFFAFRQLPENGPPPADSAVWWFDHETGEVVEQASTFDEWLDRFLQLRLRNAVAGQSDSKAKPARTTDSDAEHQFQVVVQFPETYFASPEEVEAFGEKLGESMPRTHDYDGFDIGSGTVNYFIYSNTPTAVLANFRKYLGTNKVEKKVRIAYREVDGETFVNLWPKRDNRPFDYS